MTSEAKPIIVLVGVDTKNFRLMDVYIGEQYDLFPVDLIQSLDLIGFPRNVMIFIVDTDNPRVKRIEILEKIKTDDLFLNIPVIGLSLKKHFAEMTKGEKWQFNDILLMPCGMEDMLTRIDIWVKTSELIRDEHPDGITYALEDSQQKM
jgi:hypothetical protein